MTAPPDSAARSASVAPAPGETATPKPTHGREHARLLQLREVGITHEGEDAATPASVSFEVSRGDVVLLLGPSGSGKSTLSLAMNGLIPHAVPAALTGRVEVAGMDAATHSVAQLSTQVGIVFQDPDAQLVTGTLLDEVAFGPENLRLPAAEVLARAESALRRVGLWERRSENPDRLSGGGRQRLAIACALAMGSPLLVLDEPTANLDPRGIDDVYAALGELAASGDKGIVLIEHNLDAAAPFVNRVVVLDAAGVPEQDRLLSALGPRMLELARTRSAGTHPYLTLPAQTTEAREALGNDALIAPEQTVVLDTDPVSARKAARAFLTPYLGLSNYSNTMKRGGFSDADVAGSGSDNLVDRIVIHGDAEALTAGLRAHLGAGADHVCVQAVPSDSALEVYRAIAPTRRSVTDS